MPPKTKGKVVAAQGPQYPVPPPAKTPPPVPPAAAKRGDIVVAGNEGFIKVVRGKLVSTSRIASNPSMLNLDSFVGANGSQVVLEDCTVKSVAMSRGAATYLLLNTSNGLLCAGALCDWDTPAPLALLHIGGARKANDSVAISSEAPIIVSIAVGSSHAVIACLRPGQQTTVVYGLGTVDDDALSKSGAAAANCVDYVPSPVLLDAFTPEGVTQLWAGEALTFAKGRRGLTAVGRMGYKVRFPEPTVIIPRAISLVSPLSAPEEAISVAIGAEKVYILLNSKEIFLLEEMTPTVHHSNTAVPEEPWRVSNVTSALFPSTRKLRSRQSMAKLTDDLKSTPDFTSSPDAVATRLGTPHHHFNSISAGKEHFVALDESTGDVYGWGSNAFGQLGDVKDVGLFLAAAVRLDVAKHSSLVGDEEAAVGVVGSDLPAVSSVAATSWGTLILFEDGSVRKLGRY